MYLYDLMFLWVLFEELIKVITRWDSFFSDGSLHNACMHTARKSIFKYLLSTVLQLSPSMFVLVIFFFFSNAKAGQGCLKRAF